MITEQLQEGWVNFTRIYCKDGYLDRWMGDSINNPNSSKKHQIQINSTVCFWRCNNSEWISQRNLGGDKILERIQFSKDFTAKEIWDSVLKK